MWNLADSPNCSRCGEIESLKHVVAGCQVSLEETRFNWRHDSILQFLAKTLAVVEKVKVYADIPGFNNPENIIEDQRPDIVIIRSTEQGEEISILELTAGYETNLAENSDRKKIDTRI